ncbi:hypothetical protein [Streptomyces sp. NPDC086989]|uniref:hypothetical protein n=1 Tax=Streptomyces sp. NPDC086989 TaxID=3365764 RepID=UPI0006BAB20D|nr:hypothetical protein OV450_2716 [Actinobacteria bacterium OV450]
MYLVHAGLRAPAAGGLLPPRIGELLLSLAGSRDAVEHVTPHPYAQPDPVLGVFVLAENLDEAEQRTESLCRRALDTLPELGGWSLTRVGVPLIAPYFERALLSPSGLAGRNGPGPIPSS